MGGDFAPSAILEGISEALDTFGDAYHLLLAGDQKKIETELKRLQKFGDPRLEIVHASQVIEMGEHPAKAVRSKRDSSINVAANLVKQKRARGLFSAGNTGAAVGSSYLKWRMLPGIERPGIATVLPSETGHFLLMDSGATVDCNSANLVQFAVMGDIYAKRILKKESPRIGLLCNGTEDEKGNRLIAETFPLLKEIEELNFIGNVEGHDLFAGNVDVVICDGFVGNIVLKTCEQLSKMFTNMVKQQIMSKTIWKIGGLLAKGAFADLRKKTDASEFGGAPLLGVQGICVIGHGNSKAKSVCNGIKAVGDLIQMNVNETIIEQIHQYGLESIR